MYLSDTSPIPEPLLVKDLTVTKIESDLLENASVTSDEEEDEHIYDIPDMEHTTKKVMIKLWAASFMCFLLMAVEAVGGVIAHSLAILTDAAHMFSDISGFVISIFSIW